MSRDLHAWERLAKAAKPADPQPRPAAPPAVPWLGELEPRLRGRFLRLLWRRGALWAALLAVSVLAAALWMLDPAEDSSPPKPAEPSIPLPPTP